MRKSRSWTWRTLLVLAAVGCGNGGGGGQSLTVEQACTDVSATICDKVFTCPEGALARVLLGGSLEACTPVARGFCPMCMPDQTYHGDKAYQCVQAIKQVMCSSIPGIVATGDPVAQFPVCGEICTGGSGGDAAAGQ